MNKPLTRFAAQRILPAVLACVLAFVGLALLPGLAQAQDGARAEAPSSAETQRKIEALQAQLEQIQRESDLKLEALKRETDQQVQLLQQQIALISAAVQGSATVTNTEVASTATATANVAHTEVAVAAPAVAASTPASAATPAASAVAAVPAVAAAEAPGKLSVYGDFRLRYETNSSDGAVPSWDRGVLRARLGARYELLDQLFLGARLATGDANNPRTTDVNLGGFDSDFDVNLDLAYLAYTHDSLFLTGGKYAKPFNSTELVWDGDVNLEGAGGYYDVVKTDAGSARLTAVYFVINQDIIQEGSEMIGGQAAFTFKPASDWNVSLNAAYYDYDLGILNPSMPGGARGNTVTPSGLHYVSDFNLLDIMGTLTYTGFGDRWKIWLLGDYVKNLGAKVAGDTGYEFDLFAGALDHPNRFLLHYGYAQTQTDAVLGLFSNDNIVYPTNYVMHTFSIDYVLREHVFLGLTNYLYRRLDPDPLSPFENDWVSRTRLNLYFTF